MRRPVASPAQARSRSKLFPAPVRGWIENENLAAAQPAGAAVLDNWFPTQTSIRVRGGKATRATVGSSPVLRLFTYETAGSSYLFAATATAIYDVSALDPDTAPTASVTGQTSGYYSTQQIGTVGGTFVVAVNGDDVMWRFDGTEWLPCNGAAVRKLAYDGGTGAFARGETVTGAGGASATILAVSGTTAVGTLFIGPVTGGPFVNNEALTGSGTGAATANGADSAGSSVTITGVATDDLSFVWLAKNRLWFVEKNTLTAWYLPVDSIGGAAADVSLAGIFKRGGSLMFGASWSIDTGDGLDDKVVFVSDQGEVAVYRGSNPADANDWALEGRYDIAQPLGPNATMQAGGDLVIATVVGLVPLSEAIRKDPAALSISAISRAIEPSWREQAALRQSGKPWEIAKWQERNLALVTLPHSLDGMQFVVNLQTGAWCRYNGWDAQSATIWNGTLYFGQADGDICEAETTGSDDGVPYECRYAGLFDHLGNRASYKQTHMVRGVFRAATQFNARVSASKDYTVAFPSPPNAAVNVASSAWDVAVWDVAVWDNRDLLSVTTRWVSVNETGFVISPQVQITCGDAITPSVELAAIDMIYEVGGVVV